MPLRPRTVPRLLAVLSVLLIAAMGTAGASSADPYGELGHFADKPGELQTPEAAFGVNGEDGSVWVVDQEKEGTRFRIQKFEKVGGVFKAVASASFKPKNPVHESETEIQGIAFDPSNHRAYVLVVEERAGGTGKIDPFLNAASQLYSFSTQTSGSKIEFTAGTTEGVLAGPEVLEPASKEHGHSLLEPGGIAVNPVTHQVLITGWVDRGKLGGGAEEEKTPSVVALTEKGAVASRWVDESGFFAECGCLNSPVVSSTGHIYALAQEYEIVEIPSSLASKTPATSVFQMPNVESCLNVVCPWQEKLTKFPGEGGEEGAQMSIGPEGKIYVRDRIRLATEKNNQFGGVMVLGPEFVEQGWIGGGSSATESEACAVNELVARPKVAAGAEKVYMLSRAPTKPKIIELGPGGSNCPHGTATTPTAKAGGVELEAFPIANKVTFSSTLTQANAVTTEWEFEPGVTETVTLRQQETTLVEHKFAKEGKFTVVEKIHTDNLATPVIEKTRSITILGPPKVKKEEPIVNGTEATLKAEVDPNLESTKCHFEYGPASEPFGAGSKQVPCAVEPGEGEEFVPESTTVTGLEPGTEYRFRLVAESASGKTEPTGTTFLVKAAGAPEAVTLAATAVASSSATLNGTVNPQKVTTECKFVYGTTTAYGKEAPCATSPGNGSSPVAVSASISGLTGNTTYHFKLLAENTSKEKLKGAGADRELKTTEAGEAPTAETLPAGGVTQTTATLKGTVNPKGEPTECKFEYGPSTAYGSEAPCAPAPGSGRGNVEASAAISGLTPGAPYHFRIVAKNPLGKAEGADKELTALPKLAPTAETLGASGVTQTAATLTGNVNPKGETTSCRFLYGPTTAYGKEATCASSPGGGNTGVGVSAGIGGLSASAVYHYKLLAESSAGKVEGADAELKTAAEPAKETPKETPRETPKETPSGGVKDEIVVKPVPNVTIAGTSMTVPANGTFGLQLSCPAGETQCAGTVTLKTLTAVAAGRALAAKKAILTLATASFTLSGGNLKVLTLHLSAKAKKLLAKLHTVRARVTIVAHDPAGTTHTTTAVLTLKAKKKH
jgi:hypothetical protein